ncbi:MAG: prolipoprotein diacylglyceryl transferase [Lachnospiraceae bacterium]
MLGAAISFPNLGIEIEKLNNTFTVFGIEIAYYGLIIGIGVLLGAALAFREAKKTGQNVEDYIDLALYGVVFAIIGARIYYVIFEWDYYSSHPEKIIRIDEGGLAIYGGIIAAVLTCIVLAKIKKLSFWQMADTGCLGLITGQIIGRWGNFFNREAFGGDSDGLFAMRIDTWDTDVAVTVPESVHYIDDAGRYIQVQPTFLYESCWNLMVLILILIFKKHKKYNGEVFLWYIFGYGAGRSIIEGFRTDQLLIPGTEIAVSQALSIVLVILVGILLIYNRVKLSKGKNVRLPDTVKKM